LLEIEDNGRAMYRYAGSASARLRQYLAERKAISAAMSALGARNSAAKAAAARENGKRGGRPKKAREE
jgi:hypothetical protein